MFRLLSLLLALTVLSACSTMDERATQKITIKTPGVEESVCTLKNRMNHVKVRPPETVIINNAQEDLTIRCRATSNRERTMVIHARTSPTVFLNVWNGFLPGFAWDKGTKAMFKYPKMVEVDFNGIDPKPNPLPDYHNFAVAHPELTGIEEFRAGWPSLISDKGAPPVPSAKKFEEYMDDAGFSDTVASPAKSIATTESLTRQMNPGVFNNTYSSRPAPAPSSAVQNAITGDTSGNATSRPVKLFQP